MKKVLIPLQGLFLVLSLLQCAGTPSTDPKVVACKTKCNSTSDGCVRKAAKNEAKKAACEAVKNKCSADCEKR